MNSFHDERLRIVNETDDSGYLIGHLHKDLGTSPLSILQLILHQIWFASITFDCV